MTNSPDAGDFDRLRQRLADAEAARQRAEADRDAMGALLSAIGATVDVARSWVASRRIPGGSDDGPAQLVQSRVALD